MKLARLLALPWMALSKPWRKGIGICFAILLAVVAISGVVARQRATGLLFIGPVMAFIDCFFWAGVLSQSLLLAREAHRLRLPALGREVSASLALYALLTIALPALWLAWMGGNATVMLTEIGMGAGLGMAYATLPSYLGICVCLVPFLRDQAGPWLPMPSTSPDRFLAWAVPSVLLLWLLIAVLWRSTVRRDFGLSRGRKPIMLNLRTQAWYGRGRSNQMEVEQIRRRVRWMQPEVDLRRCGPNHSLPSLLIAMGGWSMPQTPVSRLRQLGILLASMLLPLLVIAVASHGDDFLRNFFDSTNMLMVGLSMVGAVLALAQAQTLQRRWNRQNAELPLLALLPGLGDSAQVKRALLQANLLPTLGLQALLALAMLGFAATLRLDAGSCAVLLLGPLTGAAMLGAFALITLGGVRIGDGWQFALAVYGYLLVNISAMLALPLFDGQPLIRHPTVALVAAIAWAGLFAPLVRLGIRGWRGLQARPHPFMSN